MLRKKEKAQGLVEFALILPVLLLLLLGIIEAARVIWAYITVQTAAREAARYAVSGKPYVFFDTSANCENPEGDANATNPWICGPYSRTVAIKQIAKNRGQTLAWTAICDTPGLFAPGSACERTPGAFGVLVVGQTDITASTEVTDVVDHAGKQGLNVQVSTFYNVKMVDPIFDVIMAGNFIQVRGQISMQNEGVDEALGGAPPPAIGRPVITGTGPSGTGPAGEKIRALNSPVALAGTLVVRLEDHFPSGGPYDIYLKAQDNTLYKICTAVTTFPDTNDGEFNCPIGLAPAGFYTLFSALTGFQNPIATWDQQVEVKGDAPKILVDNGQGSNIAAVNSDVLINLLAHQTIDEPFDLFLVDATSTISYPIQSNVNVADSPLTWHIPSSIGNPCPFVVDGPACTVQSYRVSDGQLYGTGEMYINQPQIVLGGGNTTYAQGEPMYIYLVGHTPGVEYDLKITKNGGGNTLWLGRTQATNPSGGTTFPVSWFVPAVGWTDGDYTITSHPAQGSTPRNPASMTSANQVADQAVTINTPSAPFLTIDGGYNWPAGSFINIRAHKHPQNVTYYFNFGSWRVPITPTNTFSTGSAETYVTGYVIPLTATTTVTQTFVLASFNITDTLIAQRDVIVSPVPVITVLEGSVVLPDSIITIQLTSHAPQSSYKIFYNGIELGPVLTDASGQGQLKYDLSNLNPNDTSSPSYTSNLGNPFPMKSVFLLTGTDVATTQLTLQAADLRITNIQFPPSPALNTTIPVTYTVQNSSTVPISRFFDIDLYLDPSPRVPVPATLNGPIGIPGDFKVWRNSAAPGATFNVVQPFFLGSYGPHQFYGFADTSNAIRGEPEANNILSNTLTIPCNPTFITDTFNTLTTTWTTKPYGDGNNSVSPAIVSVSGNNRLRLRSDGSSTLGSNDDSGAPPRGYVFFHKTTPITSAGGLDVRVQVFLAPDNRNGAKAGLELRDSLNSTSAKIEFGLTRVTTGTWRIQAVFRDGVVPTPASVYTTTDLNLSTPIWLRIQRYGGTNTFLFYWVQSASTSPTWGAPVYSTTIGMSNQLEYGLFVNSANNSPSTFPTADFDNFSVGNPCLAAQGPPPNNNTPPGLTTCTDPLKQQSFEPPLSSWILEGADGVTPSPGSAHTGNSKLAAPTFDFNFHTPSFYQQFTMPSFVISSTTTLKLNLFKNINNLAGNFLSGIDDDPNDLFYAIITDGPTLASTQVTQAVVVANGVMGGGSYNPTKWDEVNVTLPVATGINLETYAGQNLYLHFYNNSNVSCAPPFPNANCHATEFYFDDVKLEPCTTEPVPSVVTTRLKGEVILHQGNSLQKISGVKVWAYAEGGQLYETTTIQNGEFNFYNLPATSKGIKYFLYAEHFFVDSKNPNQIQTFANDSSVIVTTANVNTSPATARLDLFAILLP